MRRILIVAFTLLPGSLEAAAGHGTIPLPVFERNCGQAAPNVDFVLRTPEYTALLTGTGAFLRGPGSVLRMTIVGGKPHPKPMAGPSATTQVSYFISNDRDRWRQGVPTYPKVGYQGIYPGIAIVYYISNGRLEYDFLVDAGADPGQIRLRFAGSTSIGIDSEGDLIIRLQDRVLRHRKPEIYQEQDGRRQSIPGRYVLRGDVVRFEAGPYNAGLPLVIDPVLTYSTRLGGSQNDAAYGIAVDSAGYSYVVGETWSPNFPQKGGLELAGGDLDVFVAKFATDGSGLVFSAVLGGHSTDSGRAIAVDSGGNIYITGITYSTDFPVTAGAFQTQSSGQEDVFVAKLAPNGGSLLYSTYLGGSGNDFATGIALDASGNTYITGYTNSTNFPTTAAAFQRGYMGGYFDAFVTKLNAAGNALVYSTYLGGTGNDTAQAIQVDSSGAAYVTGTTDSQNFPSQNPLQPSLAGNTDVFVAKLNPAGSGLVFSTYLGGSGADNGRALALDSTGNVYVAGSTSSADFPVTSGAVQNQLKGGYNAFLAKLNSAGSTLTYASFLGGSGSDEAEAVAVNSAGLVFLAGFTYSADFPTQNAVQPTYGGGCDGFLAVIQASGALITSTYLGGGAEDQILALATDSASGIYLAGFTFSANFPVTPGAYDTTPKGGEDAVITKINGPGVPQAVSVSPGSGNGLTQTFRFVYSDTAGYANLSWVQAMVNSAVSPSNSCWLFYSPGGNVLWLMNDSASQWLGPVPLGASGTLQNSQCSVDVAHSSAVGSGDNITLIFPITFSGTFAGARSTYMIAVDNYGLSPGWQTMGSWTVPKPGPWNASVSPSAGTGLSQTFSFVYGDSAGYTNLSWVQAMVNSTISPNNSCWIFYSPGANVAWLMNDAATQWLGPLSLGGSGTLQNSQCTVDVAHSSAVGSANSITLTFPITFRSTFAGAKSIYMIAVDNAGLSPGWQTMGSWTVPKPGPWNASVSPSAGTGLSQTFSFVYGDSAGYTNLSWVQAMVNSTISPNNSCWIFYSPAANVAWLMNDAATQWLGPLALGGSGTLQNSQCMVDVAHSSAVGSANSITLTFPITFSSTFAGAKSIYMIAVDNAGLSPGWQTMGSWTVP